MSLSAEERQRKELLRIFQSDRRAAHKHLFPHRHKDDTPEFHGDIIDLYMDPHPLVAMMAFRGGAKSTISEESVCLEALFQEFEFCLLVGNNYGSAVQRLAAIKYELETNDALIELFGDQKGSTWSEDVIILANGRKIQAMGARQSMRGVKHNDARPDRAYIDDLEDEEGVATEEARRKTKSWLNKVLRPALHPTRGKVRMIGTPLHPQALIVEKCNDPAWKSRKFPIYYLNEEGIETPTWPARFPMEWIAQTRKDYAGDGNLIEFEQEYMCRAEDAAAKPFQKSMIRVTPEPITTWTPKKIFVDPARTVGKRSARTGYAVWDWTGNRLHVHDAFGHFHKPDEIVNEIFRLDELYKPVEIGVERDGLEEFLLQPLRQAQIQRGISLPIVPMKAPKDKEGFIRGLQPFYKAGEVIHMKPLPDLDLELMQFPTGRIDVPNALAYALRMRAGQAVYGDFATLHIGEELLPVARHPAWLVMNARASQTTALLVQYIDGSIRVYHDWVVQQPAADCFSIIMHEARMRSNGARFNVTAPMEEYDQYSNNGLVAAARREKQQPQRVGAALTAEGKLAPWLRKQVRGAPAFMVDGSCRWLVNGLANGYARDINKDGSLQDKPKDNAYRALIEGLEAFVAWFDVAQQSMDDNLQERQYATAPNGQRYLTSRALGPQHGR
jgi:hypothetical protein